ncbi:hypothetical protein ACQBAT_00775 [Ornithinimicrobium sp. Y1847]|uniref:hypothetical protein n=1 Tax=Ornithinimicrobium sp. Y1847 TaxID=3405419 RepID=UPI003B66B722
MSAQPQSPNITDFPVEEVTCLPMPRTSWCEDLQRTTVVEEFIGAESFTAALRGLEWGPASLIAELSGPGWSTVLLLQPTGFSSQMIVTDLDTGLQRTASRGAVAAQLGPFVTSFVVARPRP